jgi:hypothetical protein
MRSLQVYQPSSETGLLEMKFPSSIPSEVSGVQTLLQNIALFLKTTPGSDSFDPERGTILGDQAAMAKSFTNMDQVRVSVSDAVDRTQLYILTQQQKQREAGQYIGPDATLTKLEVNNIYQGDDPTSIFVEILVYTEGNKQYFLTV